MKHKLFISLLAGIILLPSCKNRNTDFLNRFQKSVVQVKAIDSLDLAKYGILMPKHIFKYNDVFVIEKMEENNAVDLCDFSSGKIIHCFKKGRGPGEMLFSNSPQLIDSLLYIYDVDLRNYFELNICKTIRTGMQSSSLIFSYSAGAKDKTSICMPTGICKAGNNIISTGFFTPGKWYVEMTREGRVINGVDYYSPEEFEGWTDQALSAFHINSNMSVSPDGHKVICALMFAGVFSLSNVSDNLEEYERAIFDKSQAKETSGKNVPAVKYGEKSTVTFCDVQSDDKNIYVLYSGKELGSFNPYESDHLLVIDWKGHPVKEYRLSRNINSFYIDGNMLYGTSTYPESRLFIFKLN
ncbi:MAG: TolB-like 6-bladed beta-propeller domain-containing protein [Bacteroidales bacterium]|jgi:hypothetical protein|nr:TolB-like 6-bladed beta-propeller domain-containing protein [Bacteroidales bacterium]